MKTKTCRCGTMKVVFKNRAIIELQSGFLYGSPHTHAQCFECGGRIRIAFTVHHIDKEGKVFHPKSAKRKTRAKSTRSKTGKKNKNRTTGSDWRFVD